MGIIGNKILQFVEKEKRLKKGVDIWMVVWYYNKAVARESKKQEKTAVVRDRKESNDTRRKALFFQISERKFRNKKIKKLKKLLTKA